jgi:hypothetical protein
VVIELRFFDGTGGHAFDMNRAQQDRARSGKLVENIRQSRLQMGP